MKYIRHYQNTIIAKIKNKASNTIPSILAGLCSEIFSTMNKSSDSKNLFRCTAHLRNVILLFYILLIFPNKRKYSGVKRYMLKMG